MRVLIDWGPWFIIALTMFFGLILILIWSYGVLKYRNFRWISESKRDRIN